MAACAAAMRAMILSNIHRDWKNIESMYLHVLQILLAKLTNNRQKTQHPARYSRFTCKILQPLFERTNCLNRTCSFQVHQSNEYFARPHLSDECFLIKVGITPLVWHFSAVFCVELSYHIFHVIRQLAHTKIHDFIRYLVIIGSSYVHTIWFINHWCQDNALF